MFDWPHRDIIFKDAGEAFVRDNPGVIGSIDCTEIFLEKPSSLQNQYQCFSNYKSTTTKKGLIVMVDPRGTVLYVSHLYSGSISDREIVLRSGFLNVLKYKMEKGNMKTGDIILADKGFNIGNLFAEIGINLNISTFRTTGQQFAPQEVICIRKIEKERIHVERAIGGMKTFLIIHNRVPISLAGSINQIFLICTTLTNFRCKYSKKFKC